MDMLRTGSIVLIVSDKVKVIMRVDELKDQRVFGKEAICSVDGGPWDLASKLVPREPEFSEPISNVVRIVNSQEFDIFIKFYPITKVASLQL